MQTAVEITGLTVQRGKVTILQELSFEVGQGSVTGLLGPSGSGKTTLLRSIVGVQRIQSGSITVLGQPAGSAQLRHQIGYVTQSPSVYPDLTVAENVRYFASLYGLSATTADTAIGEVGLSAQSGQLVGTLSGGQRSRASLACALVAQPELLILDEPTVGQDPVLREDLWQLFRGFAQRGATVLVSSHVMDEANRCDRLILLRDGGILADDTPAGVKATAGTDDLDEAFLQLIQAGGN